jgi:4-hydroxyphenylacetate 3-monooxygenase
MPRNYAEMVQRRKAMQAWAELSYGFMGRSPDHLASAIVGQRMGIEVFEKHSPDRAKALKNYYEEASRNDYFPHLCDHQSAGRARQGLGRAGRGPGRAHRRRGRRRHHDPRRQMLGTSSIMANEVFVANLQPLSPARRRSLSPALCR